jgi:hypothetical protein
MSVFTDKPAPFFDIIVHDIGRSPGLTCASAGYESGKWRHEALASYLFEWLPEFALQYSDLEGMNSATAMRLIKKAAVTVYTTAKYQKRGEFGELLLHALIREVFNSQPAISKLYFKTSTNETVKGFDAVHVVENGSDLELWLGEVKFYKDVQQAIHAVIPELQAHTDGDWLRKEFILIDSKIDPKWKHADALKKLISDRTSLDVIFKTTCIPVLLTYDSENVNQYSEVTAAFQTGLTEEVEGVYTNFAGRELPPLRVHLFLVPLACKKALLEVLQQKLEGLQR